MKHTKITLLFAAVCAVAAAFSCPQAAQAQTQAAMNIDAGREADKADAAMSAAYRKLMGVLNSGQKAKLKKAQRAWLNFRDAEADLLSSGSEGGSMHPMVYAGHIQGITEERTRELKEAYHQFTTEGEM